VGNGWDYEADEIFTISLTSLSYPFSDTVREFFIDHIMNIFTLEEQDSIFELYKSTMNLGAYPLLFAEARRETYTRAWEVFGERMWDDFYEQTIMISIAMGVGTVLKFIPFTSAIAGAAFMLTYTILMKYFMDEKSAVAASKEASEKFYTLGSREAIQLNDRMIANRVSRDSSLAAIQGHPAAYYTLIHGGPTGHDYTAEVIASPPNEMRTSRATLGMAAYVATLGQIPELFFGLDFDYSNIDYEQFTTALYTYNDYPFYTYYHKGLFGIPKMSDPYQYNTLGYVEQKITGASTAMNAIFGDAEPILDEIRPVSYDGAVRYTFEKRSHTSLVSPLFQPIVLSEPRYNFLKELGLVSPGHLGITVKHTGSIGSLGMNPYGLTAAESLKYGAKIPLAFNKTFGYPIISVSLGIKHGVRTIDTITIPEEIYEVKGGDLFITASLEDLAETSDKYNAFVGSDAENIPSNMYYYIEVTFHRFVPFSAEYEGLALAQVGHYAVMDQVHQYTFAEISSNMIAEIGYTEVLTMMSTLASAPAMIFYSYASFKAEQEVGTKVMSEFVKGIHKVLFRAFVVAPISEMIEELTIDVILEGLIEGYLREWGYSDNFGQWCSLLATSVREGVSLSNRIDSSIKHKSKAKFDLESKVGKIDAQLESQNLNSEQKQNLKDKKVKLESEIATLQQKIEKRQAIRDALKLTTSLLYAAATMGFGGFSLGGMSSLISTSYDQFVKEPLKRAISGNSKLKTILKRSMQIPAQMGRVQELMAELDTDSKKYKNLENTYYHLIYERNQLNAMIEEMFKASDISQDIDSEVLDKTGSIKLSQQETDVRNNLQKLTSQGKTEAAINTWADYALSLKEVQSQEEIKGYILEAKYNKKQISMQARKDIIEGSIVLAKSMIEKSNPIDARFITSEGLIAVDPNFYVLAETREDFDMIRKSQYKKYTPKASFLRGEKWKTFNTAFMRMKYRHETTKDAMIDENTPSNDYLDWLYDEVSKLSPTLKGLSGTYLNYFPGYIIKGKHKYIGNLIADLKSKLIKDKYQDMEFSLTIAASTTEGVKAFKLYETRHSHIDVNLLLKTEKINPLTAKFILKAERDISNSYARYLDVDNRLEKIDPTIGMFVKANWKKGTQSPNYGLGVLFRHDLLNLLIELNLIKLDSKGKFTFGALDEFLNYESGHGPIDRVLAALSGGVQFEFEQTTLDRMLGKILINIYADKNIQDWEYKMERIKALFDEYYALFGHEKNNAFYRDARIVATISAQIFFDTFEEVKTLSLGKGRDSMKGHAISDVLPKLDEEDSEGYRINNIFRDLIEGKIPSGDRAEILKKKVEKYFESAIESAYDAYDNTPPAYSNQLDFYFLDNMDNRVQELTDALDTILYFLDSYIEKCYSTDRIIKQIKSSDNNKNSAFAQFLIEFLRDHDTNLAFGEFSSLRELSRFLFPDQSDDYIQATSNAENLPDFNTLWSSLIASFDWEFKREQSNYHINDIRACYMKHIENFIASSPVSSKLPDGKDYYSTVPYLSRESRVSSFSTHTKNQLLAKKVELSEKLRKAYGAAGISSSLPVFYSDMIIHTPTGIFQEMSKINDFIAKTFDDFLNDKIDNHQFEFLLDIYYDAINILQEFLTEYGMLNHEIEVQHRWATYLHGYNWYSRDFKYRKETDQYRIKPNYGSDYSSVLQSLSPETQENFYEFIINGYTNPWRYLDAKVKHDWPFDNEIFDVVTAHELSDWRSNNRLSQIPVVSDRLFSSFVEHFHDEGIYQQLVQGNSKKTDPNVPEIAKKIANNLPLIDTKSSKSTILDSDEIIISHSTTGLALNLLVKNMPECIAHEYHSMDLSDIDGDGPLEQYRVWYAKGDLLFYDMKFYGGDFKPGMSVLSPNTKDHFINAFAQQIKSSLSQQADLGSAPDAEVESIIFNYGISKDGQNIEVVVFKTKLSYMKILEFLANLQSSDPEVNWKSDWVKYVEDKAKKDEKIDNDYDKYSDAQIGIRSQIPEVYKKFLVDYWEIGHIEEYVQSLIASLKADNRNKGAEYWENWLAFAGAEIDAMRTELLES